jgi:hypothetical protein
MQPGVNVGKGVGLGVGRAAADELTAMEKSIISTTKTTAPVFVPARTKDLSWFLAFFAEDMGDSF